MNLIHKVRKGLATVLATSVVAMTLVVSPSAQAASFADVPADAWFAPYVNALTEAGVFKAQDNFRPADNMNRAEFVKTLVVAAGVSMEGAAEAGFSDVSSSDWFAPYVNAAVAAGIINGSDVSSTFRPVDNVTRAEAVKIALNAFGVDYASYVEPKAMFSDDEGHWAEDMISAAYNLSIVDGQAGSKTAFAPNEAISRSAVAKVATFAVIVAEDPASYVRFDDGSSAFSVFEADEITSQVAALIEAPVTGSTEEPTDEEPTDEEPTTETPVASDGTLEVSLAADSPASATLPGAVAGITVAKFDVTANGDDVVLQSLVLRRGGLGADGVVSSVAVLDENGRVSKSKTINNTTDEATITFLSGGVTVKAGETKTLSVVAALGAAATYNGSEFNIELVSASAVVSNAQEVVGDFPVKGNIMKLGSTDAASLQFLADGEPSDPKLGETGVEITKFRLKNTSSQDSISFKSITLKEEGTVDESDELANFDLYIEGAKVASTASAQNKYITFNLETPYVIKSSKTVKLAVRADVIGGADKTIMFALDNTLDLVADDMKTGFGAGVTYTDEATYEALSLTVQAGEVTLLSVDASNTDVLKDKDDIVAGTIKLATKAGKDLELQKVTLNLSVTGTTDVDGDDTIAELIENVELYDVKTGTVYDLTGASTADSVDGATDAATFADTSLNIPVTGEKEFQVRFDTKNVASIAYVTFTWSLSTGNPGFYLVETGDDTAVSDITPSSLSFKRLTGASSTTTISTITQSSTKNAVIGTKEVEALEFEVKAGSASALDLDEVKVTGTVTDAAPTTSTAFSNTRVNKLTLYKVEGSTKTALDSVSGSQIASNVATFDGFKVAIAANATARFLVTLDIVDDSTKASDTINLALTSVSLSDSDSDDVTSGTVNGSANTTLNTAIGAASNRTITIKGVGSLAVSADTTDSATDKQKYVLGNATSDFVASYELTATNEGVVIRDLTMTAAGVSAADFKAAVSEIVLYKEDKTTEIARKSVTALTTEFTDINYTVAEGSENIYVKVVANKQGKDQAGKIVSGMTLAMSATDADGASSNKQLSSLPVASGASLAFNVVPTRISNVEFVDSFGGISVASKLTNGENNVAILKVTTDASSNTDATDGTSLKTVLTALGFTIESDATMGANSVVVEKINGTGDDEFATVHTANPTSATAVATTLSSAASVNKEIDNGTSVYYVIKATVSGLSDSTQKYVQVKISGLDSGDIAYRTDDSDGLEFIVIDGGLDVNGDGTVDGSDDASNLVVGTDQFDVINGALDMDEDGDVTSEATSNLVVSGTEQFDVLANGTIDIDEDADADTDDDFSSSRTSLLIPNLTKIEAKKVSQ